MVEPADSKSATSYRSTQSSRSSVLEKAREYNRRIEDEQRRSKSMERKSAERPQPGNRASTRERAMASVRQEEVRQSDVQRGGTGSSNRNTSQNLAAPAPAPAKKASPSKSNRQQEPPEAVVSPELLVDALSGHEDGLLAIAEKLMEHYDEGYDSMGEAIIDAFADVQKLFQHVVEAAHMEGAAFEASRREEELNELRQQLQNSNISGEVQPHASTPSNGRHDELIDQDVKDILTDAIRQGSSLRNAHQHDECYALYQQVCQSASALLPVDSDHRGRLQLSLARAESMSSDRACAILRYSMDDVLRSGLTANIPLPDISQRSDMVLQRPKELPSLKNGGSQGVVQSSEEALASLVEELKEVLGAPVYDNSPLQSVAQRFWKALDEAQKAQNKNEERLEHALGKLKGEYLLARAEWEEKLTASLEQVEYYKRKYQEQKETTKGEMYLEQARSNMEESAKWHTEDGNITLDSIGSRRSGPGSVASLSSGLAQQARTIVQSVGNFNCAGLNETNVTVDNTDSELPPSGSRLRRGRSETRRDFAAGSVPNL